MQKKYPRTFSCLTCARMTDSRHSVRSCDRCAIINDLLEREVWCDPSGAYTFMSTSILCIQTCLLWLAERRMDVDCCQYTSCHGCHRATTSCPAYLPLILPPVAIVVGLRHAMWYPVPERQVYGHWLQGHMAKAKADRRALGVDKRHRAGGLISYWPVARLASSRLHLRIDVLQRSE